jgi:hypothetical protein
METQAAPKPVTDAQTRFLRRLAHEVTGDGDGYVAAIHEKYANGLSSTEASAEIKHLKSLQGGARPLVQPKPKKAAATTSAPAGRYAVDLPDNKGSLLVEVTKPTSGPWAGYTFVKTVPLIAEVSQEPIKGAVAVKVLAAIEENPRGCAGMFGRITGRCGQCNRRLSDPTSISLGVGPECMGRF